jgi:hypothetical protein
MAAEPFEVSITEAEIADLRERLRRTRWPEPEPVDDWSQGLPLAYAQELCRSCLVSRSRTKALRVFMVSGSALAISRRPDSNIGHKSITTTVDLYGHLVPEASGRARDALDKAFAGTRVCPNVPPDATESR